MSSNNTTTIPTPYYPVNMAVFVSQSILLIIGISGNLLVICAIASDRRLRNSLNYLVLNLSVCNICAVGFTIPFQLVMMQNNKDFVFGDWGCKILYPCATWSFNVSVSFLLTITIDRYIAIVYPIRWRLRRNHTLKIIVANYLYGVVTVLPYALNIEIRYTANGHRYCAEKWSPTVFKFYTVFLFMMQYAIPFLAMAVLYTIAWLHLKRYNDWTDRLSENASKARSASVSPGDRSTSAHHSFDTSDRSSDGSACSCEYTNALLSGSTSNIGNRPRNLSIVSTYSDEVKMMCLDFCCPVLSCLPSWMRRCCGNNQGESSTTKILITSETENNTRTSSQTSHQQNGDLVAARRRRRRTIRTFFMFLFIITIFGVSALPAQLTWLLKSFGGASKLTFTAYRIFEFMHYVNYVTNPFIYGGLNKVFLRAYKKLFLCSFLSSSSRDSSVWSRGTSSYHSGGGGSGHKRKHETPLLCSFSTGKHLFFNLYFD